MHILVLGSGAVGLAAATLFAREKDVQEVTIGDVNLANATRAANLVTQIGTGTRIQAVQVDAASSDSVALAAGEAAFVYNATASVFNLPVLNACIGIGASYMDTAAELPVPGVADTANIAVLMDRDRDARAAGITAISCMGIGPGYTNVAVHYMIDRMDRAQRVRIKWFDLVEADELVSTWSPAGLMGEFLGGPAPMVWEAGQLRPGRFLYSEACDFPQPVGRRTVYTATFHPELYMLPNYLPDDKGKTIEYLDMMGGMDIGDLPMKDVWLTAIQRQAVKERFEKPLKTGSEMLAAFGSSFTAPADFKDAVDRGIIRNETNSVAIEVSGTKDGRAVTHTLYNTTVMAEAVKLSPFSSVVGYCTAQCGVTVALMVLRGEIALKGVMTPDRLTPPEKILKRLASDALRIEEKIEGRF